MARPVTRLPQLAARSLPQSTGRLLIGAQCLRTSSGTPGRLCVQRNLSTTVQRKRQKTISQSNEIYRRGPFSVASALVFIACGFGMWYYFTSEKARLKRQRTREAAKGYGKPKIGGPFELVDQNEKPFTSEDMKGKFSLVYFGFSNCPDICPDELDKMSRMIDMVKTKRGEVLLPIVVTCDPARDSPAVLKQYLSEFHPKMIGLTGTWEQIKAMCKAYRVYFSTPPHVKPGQDYLVDHSIYFYLMDPEGDFIEVIGREHTAEKGAKLIADHIDKWLGRTVTADSWMEVIETDLESLPRWKKKYKPNLE